MTTPANEGIQLRRLLLAPLGLGLGAAFLAQLIVASTSPDWRTSVLTAIMDWTPWFFVAPVVLWFAGRVPIGPHNLRWTLPTHVLACALAIVLHVLIGYGIGQTAVRLGLWESRTASNPTAQSVPGETPGAARLVPRYFRARFLVPIYIALVASAHAAAHYQQRLVRERHILQTEAKLVEARLMALQMQLQPHFLFNTLHTISSLVYTRPEAADEMICALSDLLRGVLQTSQQREVTLEQEMRLVRSYLSIQQRRFNERLQWHCDIAQGVEFAAVPALLLQPLVENAIIHGIAPADTGGVVLVTAKASDGRLRLAVINSGAPLEKVNQEPPDQAAMISASGIGLANTRARLIAIYGGDFALSLETLADHRVCASVSIPLRLLSV